MDGVSPGTDSARSVSPRGIVAWSAAGGPRSPGQSVAAPGVMVAGGPTDGNARRPAANPTWNGATAARFVAIGSRRSVNVDVANAPPRRPNRIAV
jgi:hypothetical protein